MKQGRMALALALAAMLAGVAPAVPQADAAPRKPAATAAAAKRKTAALRQFSGVVTAIEAGSLTVEKGGAKPKTMTFSRDARMRTTGDLQKDARVTVWYRDEDGHAVAHRVVVKSETADAKS